MNDNTQRRHPGDRPPATAAETFRRREFEHHLQALGTSKAMASRVASSLPHHVMQALLPWPRRLRAAWRARHG